MTDTIEGLSSPDTQAKACGDCGVVPSPKTTGRGLCRRCHQARTRNGTLIDVPFRTRRRDEVLGEYIVLKREGLNRDQIAARLGMKKTTLEAALARAARAGDTRSDARPGSGGAAVPGHFLRDRQHLVTPGEWRCSCGAWLAASRDKARQVIGVHHKEVLG